ncbi:unnamed protein product [Rhizophagus irregularis]|nr:unnamed protein product [Rhizophagus irregularis]
MLKLFRCYGDSSSDNESIKEAGMAYFTKNLGFLVYKDGKNHMDASNDIQYSIENAKESNIVPLLILIEHCEVDFESDIYKQINKIIMNIIMKIIHILHF